MKALHISFGFPPDPPGGTELYIQALCRELKTLGVGSVVAAPAAQAAEYVADGVRVRRFATGPQRLEHYYAGDPEAAASFAHILDDEEPDVVHQHAMTPACSQLLAIEASRRRIPVVFTYHTPTVTCQRGTLLEWGTTPCDGVLSVARCTACSLEGLGTGRFLGRSLALIPPDAGNIVGRLEKQGGAWTAVRMSSLMQRRHDAIRTLLATADRLVAPTAWAETLLRSNGVPAVKIVRSPHGIAAAELAPRAKVTVGARALRTMHLGRIDPAKGTELLIRAVRARPHLDVELDIMGVTQGAASETLAAALRALAGADARIQFLAPLAPNQVIPAMAEYDLVAVPSQGLETGPLVVLEAFAAGVPVVGSALGGIADNVVDGVNGVLVRPFDSQDAWSAALARCVEEGLADSLKQGVQPPRTFAAVAEDMRDVYLSLAAAGSRAAMLPVPG